MKVEFDTRLRDLDLSNKAQQLQGTATRPGAGAESVPFQASLLSRIQKLEEYQKGYQDAGGDKGKVNTVVEDLPFKADILARLQTLEAARLTQGKKGGGSAPDEKQQDAIMTALKRIESLESKALDNYQQKMLDFKNEQDEKLLKKVLELEQRIPDPAVGDPRLDMALGRIQTVENMMAAYRQ